MLLEHPERTLHIELTCVGAGQAGTKPEPFLPSSRLVLMGYMDIKEGVLRKWQCSDLHPRCQEVALKAGKPPLKGKWCMSSPGLGD